MMRPISDKTSAELRVRRRFAGIRGGRCGSATRTIRSRGFRLDHGRLLEGDLIGSPVRETHLTLAIRVVRVSCLFVVLGHGNDTRLDARVHLLS